jgi:lipoprotein NlpI
MKATSIKAVLLAASLIFPTWSLAQTKSKDAAAYSSRGIAKLQKNDWDGAIADFNRALQFDPKLAQAYDNRGLAKTEKGDLEGAITDFNRVLQLNPKNGIAYNNRGNAKAHKGDFDGAIADFNRALQLNPKLAKAYYNRGNAKREKYDLLVSGAVDEFPFPDYDLGTRKVEKGYLNAAVADFNRTLQLNPKLAKAYDNRGLAKFSRGDLDGAMADFNSALQLDPKLAPAYEARGVAKEQKGDLDGAIADYNHAIELNPKLDGAYLNRGKAKAYKGNTDSAIADFNRALQLNPKLARAYAGRGSANFLAHNWMAALHDYRRFSELSQRNQEYPRLFIWIIRSRLGEREAADKELATHFNAEPGTWVSKVEAYLLGNLSEAEFLAAAASPVADTDRGQHCEAWFYAGMKNLLDGNKPAGTEFFKKCLTTEQKSPVEYHFAKAELKAVGH